MTWNGRAGLAALDAPAGEDRAVGDGHEVGVLEHPDVLLVAEAAAVAPGAAGVDGQPEPLDDEREPALGELGRQVARVGHDVDGVLAVGVVAPARAAAEHLAHEVVVAVAVLAVDAGVADRLLVGRHPAVDRLGDDAGEHAEQPQDDEGAGVGRRREDRREQRALLGEAHLDERHDALVDVELGHPLGGVGEVAQDRREPLLEEVAVDVVAAVVDRALGLRRRAGEVDDELRAAVAGTAGRLLVSVIRWRVQPRLVDAVVLGVVLPDVGAVGDLGQDLAAVGLGGLVEDRVERGLDRVAAVALEQLGRAGARPSGRPSTRRRGRRRASRASGELRVMIRSAASLGTPWSHSLIGGTIRPSSKTLVALLRHRAGHGAADVVVVAEGLDERDDLARRGTPAP